MSKYVWWIILTVLLWLVIFLPGLPFALAYGLFNWAACPHYNFLSPYCGDITAGFVLSRVAQVAFLAALAYALWRLATWRK